MAIIITPDIERAARRTDRTLRIGQGDTLSPEARALAERLSVRIIRPNGDEEIVPRTAPGATAPPASAAPVPVPTVPPSRVEPASVPPIQFPPSAPAPNPAEALRRSGQGVPDEPERAAPPPPPSPVAPLPLERYGEGRVLDPVQEIGRPVPRPAPPPPPVRPLADQPPHRPTDEPPTVTVLPVQRIPVATPTPAADAAPLAAAPPPEKPSQPPPTLLSSRRRPSYRQRRQVARGGGPTPQMGVLLGRVIDSREVRRAAEAGVRLVRIGPEAYVTRSARHLAATLGVVLYPDSSLMDIDDRTKAGKVVNPISLEPAITRQGAGMMHPGGIPIGGDHLPGTLRREEAR